MTAEELSALNREIQQRRHCLIHDFSMQVEERLSEEWGIDDGGDLCYNLVDAGRIDPREGVDAACRTVAQHYQQA